MPNNATTASKHITAMTAEELADLVERYDAGDTAVTVDQYDYAIEALEDDALLH